MSVSTLPSTRAERCAARNHELYQQCGDGADCVRYRNRTEDDILARPKERGYAVDVVILRTEKIASSKSGNPRYRFHTDNGIYITAADIQQSASLTGAEIGPAHLRIEASLVIAWRSLPAAEPKEKP